MLSTQKRLDEATSRADGLRRALPELRARLAAQEECEREERERVAEGALADVCAKANAACEVLAKKLAEADRAAQALESQREEVDRLAAQSPAEPSADCARPPGWLDEPSFTDGIEALTRVLRDGPRRPLAEREVRAKRMAREVEGQRKEISRWLRVSPGPRARLLLSRPDGVPPEVRREAEAILDGATEAGSPAPAGTREHEQEEAMTA